jgi:DNA adenine methylase
VWECHRERRLVEPFCGGLAVALGLGPRRALLNDINPHLISFYRWLKRGLVVDLEMANEEALYYRQRARFNDCLADADRQASAEAAGLFYYLNRTGFNGLCRFNASGRFNVPFGKYKQINYTTDFTPYQAALGGWQFSCGDIESIPLEPDDFVYADPPYDVPFTHYSKDGFSWADQERAARWLTAHAGPVVLVNQATDRIVALYRSLGYTLAFLDAPRMINCTGNRTPVREVIAVRNLGRMISGVA